MFPTRSFTKLHCSILINSDFLCCLIPAGHSGLHIANDTASTISQSNKEQFSENARTGVFPIVSYIMCHSLHVLWGSCINTVTDGRAHIQTNRIADNIKCRWRAVQTLRPAASEDEGGGVDKEDEDLEQKVSTLSQCE